MTMIKNRCGCGFFLVFLLLIQHLVSAQDLPVPPPVIERNVPLLRHQSRVTGGLYSIGDPSGEEQYYLELINRARANPTAEGLRLATTKDEDVVSSYKFYNVNLALAQSEFKSLASMPPLVMSAPLTQSARAHSQDMFTNRFQGHTGSDGSTISTRITKTGYAWKTIGENVYSYADSVWHGHAGFEVDWGNGAGGMQPARGHRANIHSANFREVGIGVVNGINGNVGPQIVTQDFGASSEATTFITGVAYYDVNGNGFYDPGEGIGGLSVSAQGGYQSAITSDSGGYAIPVPQTNATRVTAFSGLSLTFSSNAVISGGKNVKIDFNPAYKAPSVTGPTSVFSGAANSYKVSSVGGATSYDYQVTREIPAALDGAENALRGKTDSAGGYSFISKTVKFSGSASYHFAHPVLNRNETYTYTSSFMPGAGASLNFRSRLGWASKTQFAKVQVSLDDGATWKDVYSQAGTDSSGETGFQNRTLSLATYKGIPIRLRFNYTMTTGTVAYYQTSDNVGWFIDEVAFYDVGELSVPTIKALSATTTFSFAPTTAGTYHLAARPIISKRAWAFGPALKITCSSR